MRGIWNQPTDSNLSNLSIPDRTLTKWRIYGEERGSGNYKYNPSSHSYFGRDCWWRKDGGCTFCSWTNTYKNFRVVSVGQAMAEIESCASLGIREVFDDTGTFPPGQWMHEFAGAVRKFNGGKRHGRARITMGCNLRPGYLKRDEYRLLGEAGFRFVLFGLESANLKTLERINKGQGDGDIEQSVKWAHEAGLDPHATCMVGYPWETKADAERTVELTRSLFRRGWLRTLQATICIPYPGTELYRQCVENDWLKYQPGDWNSWDMRRPVMKTCMSDEEILAMTRGIYHSCITPGFIVKKLLSIRNLDDWRFIWKGLKFFRGHLVDFKG